MNIGELAESYLMSITHDFNGLFIEIVAMTEDGNKVKVFAHNKDTSPIAVEFIGLTMKSNFTTRDGIASLGEIEAIQANDSGFSLEGDMGFIQVVADTWLVENAL